MVEKVLRECGAEEREAACEDVLDADAAPRISGRAAADCRGWRRSDLVAERRLRWTADMMCSKEGPRGSCDQPIEPSNPRMSGFWNILSEDKRSLPVPQQEAPARLKVGCLVPAGRRGNALPLPAELEIDRGCWRLSLGYLTDDTPAPVVREYYIRASTLSDIWLRKPGLV